MPKPIASENRATNPTATPPDNHAPSSSRDPYAALLDQAVSISRRYLEEIPERFAGVTPEALANFPKLAGPLPNRGVDPHETLTLLEQFGGPGTVASAGGRYFGGVIGGALPVTVAANWISVAWDQNAALFDFSPISAYLEDVVFSWLFEIFGLPATSGGCLTTGTQMADVAALAAARTDVLRKADWDLERQGLFGAPPITILVGDEVHVTMPKALAILGFGAAQIRRIPVDGQGRMIPSHIPQIAADAAKSLHLDPASAPLILCAQIGNVNSGACDPIREICEITRKHNPNAWIHVDGAFGLWAAASPGRKHLVEGLPLADSFATDAHKWLNVPYDSGICMVRHRDPLRRAMAITAAYLGDTDKNREPMKWGPDSSRSARAIEIWTALRTLGTEGVAELIERTCAHAATFAENFREAGYEVLNDVVLNQLLVSFGDDETTNRVVAALQAEGTCWCGATTWKGRRAMRISVSSWATTDADVDRCSRAILSIAAATK